MFDRSGIKTGVLMADTSDDRWNANVRQDWLAAAAGWRDQDPRFEVLLSVMSSAIVDAAGLRPGMSVLDVASGPGASPVAIAKAVGPTGHVTSTDLLPEMVSLIEEQVAEARLDNVSVAVADAEALAFPDAAFDAVTCHIGVIYFSDVVRALREMRRVLKPSGQVTITSWGPEDQNPYFSSLIEPFWQVMDVPPPDPSKPSIFRFGSPGALTARLEQAGFERVRERQRLVHLPFAGSVEEYFSLVRRRAPTYQRLAAQVTPEQRERVDAAILSGLRQYESDGIISMPAAIVVATGVRQGR